MGHTVSTKIEIEDKASRPLSNVEKASDSLRTQIHVLREAMAKALVDGVEPMSAEFQELARRAGALQDALGDANQITREFASDTHNIDKYTSGVESIISAYGLYQSALAALGVENENLEQNMQKLIAAQTALSSVQKISNQIQDQSSAIYKLLHYEIVQYTGASKAASVATKAFNVALKALGIGLVISAVALLSEHWEDLVGWIKKSIPETKELSGAFSKIKAVAFGLGNALIQFVITPIKSMIKVFVDLKNGEFKQALNDFADMHRQQFDNILNFGKNFEQGYTAELTYQEEQRTKKVKEESDKKVKVYKDTYDKIKDLNDSLSKELLPDIAGDAQKESERRKKEYTDELNYKAEQARKVWKEISEMENYEESDPFVDDLIEKAEARKKQMQALDSSMKNLKNTGEAVGNVFSTLGGVIDGNAGSMLAWAGDTISAIASVIPSIVAMITAKQGEAIAGATAAGASVPVFPANIAAIATGLAAVMAAFMKIPKFADGGIAYGPTLGLFGEYSGASTNPEVVAPLNKLRGMLSDENLSSSGSVEFKIKGRELVGILNRENTLKQRN